MRVDNVESRIFEVEGFRVKILRDGKDVPGHRSDFSSYDWNKAAPKHWTVSKWKKKRFGEKYTGFEAEVIDGDGESVHGNMKLKNVRDTYDV